MNKLQCLVKKIHADRHNMKQPFIYIKVYVAGYAGEILGLTDI